MANFPKTAQSFAELEANFQYNFGTHVEDQPRTGVPGLTMGDVQYDPSKHHVGSINHLSVLGIALGESYVSNVLPNKPLHVRMATDLTDRAEASYVTQAKRQAAESLTDGLSDAVESSIGNLACMHLIGRAETGRPVDEFIESRDRSVAFSTAADVAKNGLTIVMSDFYGIELDEGSLEGVIAAKIFHPHEKELPANHGLLPVGGGHNVNTRKSRELAKFNNGLRADDQRIDENLLRSGAQIVHVVADGRLAEGIDAQVVDVEFAAVLSTVTSKG